MLTRIAVLAVLVGCHVGTDIDPGGGGGGGGGDDGPDSGIGPDPDGFDELIAGSWQLTGGQETYFCVTKTLTEDTWITAFRTKAPPGTHHTALSVGDPIGPDATVQCGPSDNRPTLVFGAGIGTPDVMLPDGLAVKIKAGQQLLLNLHVFNASDDPLAGFSGVAVKTSAVAVTEAGIANTGKTTDLVVPPGASTQIGTCTVPATSRSFSVFPHMHRLGVRLKATATTSSGTKTLIDMPYTFEAQRYYALAPEVMLKPGDTVKVECSYQNDTGANVLFGQSSNQEMCGLGIYVTPPWADPNCGF